MWTANAATGWAPTKTGSICSSDKRLIRHYTSVPSTLLTLCEDRQGRMWLGSYEQGCGWVSAERADYHPQDLGLGDQASIFSIVADGKGALWIGTHGSGPGLL
jgi:ligand-binding sensor domain-containing protein